MRTNSLTEVQTREGEGVKKFKNFVEVLHGSSLRSKDGEIEEVDRARLTTANHRKLLSVRDGTNYGKLNKWCSPDTSQTLTKLRFAAVQRFWLNRHFVDGCDSCDGRK